ncbi:MAG: hypothetical protein JJ885_09685 [Muricauda sp.]|jgi:hypothetical protein|nr:hypothetical protein [Allomuricauda sp.]MBO6588554.1 hypothetical protein [Allomuricauda sp.]MBO6618306.1 hypothetical protein [Allomuricauda sp.]MBO6644092.1 hypothetical protein [Allomuricauda sp.]MBO6746976.1 hypothetical protein [Allomuricauda sp.]MBO6844604.1 hypothetical protein [Allomuricauda sp.]
MKNMVPGTDLPYKFAHRIQASDDFNALLLQHYILFSDGATMVDYAIREKALLCSGTYGVEDHHAKVSAYIAFLDGLIRG